MNEQIRQLAEQAKIDYELLPDIAREPVWIAIDDELEKFAQLIVRECCQFENSYGGEAGLVARHYSRKIRKHFGVEE